VSALAPLRHPAFRRLVAGRTITTLGNAVAPVALAFAVLDLTGSVRDLGLVVGARSLTNVVFVLAGGVIADRLPRQLVMVASSLLAAASQATVAVLVLTGTATIPLLAALSAANGLVAAFALPATAALVPQTVPEGIRQQANALNRLGFNAAMIVGASAGGMLVAAVGPGWGLAVDATTFAVAAGCFALVRVPSTRTGRGADAFTELREGWTEFIGRTWLWVVVLGFCFANAAIAGGVQVLGPAVADDTVGRRAWGLVLAAQTAGMVVGALLAIRVRVRGLLRYGVACFAGEAVLLLALAAVPRVDALLVSAFVAGLAVEQFAIAWDTTMQQQIPAEKLARVYSYDILGSFVAIPLGEVAAGPAAHALGTEPALLVAAGIVLLAVIGMLASRDVRTLKNRPALQATALTEPAAVG
jgi:predicted MFS family arabinose efflux permease